MKARCCAGVFLLVCVLCGGVAARTITLKNQCSFKLWASSSDLGANVNNGWELAPNGGTASFSVSDNWNSGKVLARTGCVINSLGHLSCATGDCPLPSNMYSASNNGLYCHNIGGNPPASLIEFTLISGGVDTYDLSLVDGWNVGLSVTPTGSYSKVNNPNLGKYNCGTAVINDMVASQCPPEMQKFDSAGKFIACWSPCKAYHDHDQTTAHPEILQWDESKICCDCGENCKTPAGKACGCGDNGCLHGCSFSDQNPAHANMRCFVEQWPVASTGVTYNSVFKSISPDAYSWQFDDAASTYQCMNANYDITFCPSATPPTPACTTFTTVSGTDLYGGDIANAAASNIDGCIALCKATANCKAATLSAGVCYMKTEAALNDKRTCSGCVSAYCSATGCTSMTQLAAIDLYGADISNAAASNIDGCIALCKANANCKAATLSAGVCYMKTAAALADQRYCAGCVSAYCAGTDHCPAWTTATGTDLNGGDIANAAGASIAACQPLCAANPQCVAATWYQNVCYLKNAASIPAKKTCAGCTAGKCGGNLVAAQENEAKLE